MISKLLRGKNHKFKHKQPNRLSGLFKGNELNVNLITNPIMEVKALSLLSPISENNYTNNNTPLSSPTLDNTDICRNVNNIVDMSDNFKLFLEVDNAIVDNAIVDNAIVDNAIVDNAKNAIET